MIAFGIIWGYSLLTGHLVAPLAFAHHGNSFFAFFIGCALAELYPLISQINYKWFQPAGFFVIFFSGFLMLRYGVEVISGDSRVAFACVLWPLLIYLAINNKLLSLFLQSRPVQFLGKISFSIYLWHFVIYDLFRYSYYALSDNGSIEEPQYLLYLVLMFAVSILSWKYIENKASSNKVPVK